MNFWSHKLTTFTPTTPRHSRTSQKSDLRTGDPKWSIWLKKAICKLFSIPPSSTGRTSLWESTVSDSRSLFNILAMPSPHPMFCTLCSQLKKLVFHVLILLPLNSICCKFCCCRLCCCWCCCCCRALPRTEHVPNACLPNEVHVDEAPFWLLAWRVWTVSCFYCVQLQTMTATPLPVVLFIACWWECSGAFSPVHRSWITQRTKPMYKANAHEFLRYVPKPRVFVRKMARNYM